MTTYGCFRAETNSADISVCDQTSLKPEKAPVLVGQSAFMQRLHLQIERMGPHFRTVLVRGESGTGKELVARALHARSERATSPFTICRSAGLRGVERQKGHHELLVQAAQEGTLFLDDVEEMPLRAQKNLLTVLHQKTGLRVIAATSQDLRVMAAAGLFRQDLYQRLATVEIALEPLRNRTDDIPELARHFLNSFCLRYQKQIEGIAAEAMEMLLHHSWQGNVRELENILHNGVLHCTGTLLEPQDLSSLLHSEEPHGMSQSGATGNDEAQLRLQEVIDRHVMRVLRECSGNKVRAAERLGISRSTLYRMLETYSTEVEE